MEIKRKIAEISHTVFEKHPVRFGRKEKDDLLAELQQRFVGFGYDKSEVKVMTHKGMMTCRNLVVGDPAAKYVITAHYDTPGRNGFLLRSASLIGQTGANIVMMLMCLAVCLFEGFVAASVGLGALEINFTVLLLFLALMIIPMVIKNKNNRNDNTSGVIGVLGCAARIANLPELRSRCCFILFDNEEWGIVGSSAHAKWCRDSKIDMKSSLVINLDCIGVGDTLVAARTGGRGEKLKGLLEAMRSGGASIVEKKSVMVYMSDHANFPSSVMFSYMRRSTLGPLYIPNIHSGRDKECDLALIDDLAQRVVDALK